MAIYLQAMCLDCGRLYALNREGERAADIRCSWCQSEKHSTAFQISYLEYLDVLRLYKQ